MAGPNSRPMVVMTATERQLTRRIIEERDDRMQAVQDVWTRLETLEAQVNDLRSVPPAEVIREPKPTLPAQPAPVQNDRVIADFKKELESLRQTSSSRCAALEESAKDIRAALGKMEIDVQEGINANRESIHANRERQINLQQDLKALQAIGVSTGKLEDAAPANARQLDSSPATLVPSGGGPPDAAEMLRHEEGLKLCNNQLKLLDEKVQQQGKELNVVRSVLIEIHVNLPLHAVRASRIALRATELSREERKLALASLETKEEHIRADIERVRQRNQQSPAQALDELGTAQPPLD